MRIDKEMNLVIAGTGADGKPCFLERGEAQVSHTLACSRWRSCGVSTVSPRCRTALAGR